MSGRRSTDGSADDRKTVDAQDDWLSSNLQAWYQAVIDEPVPEHLSVLAHRLDEALASVIEPETGDVQTKRQKPESDE